MSTQILNELYSGEVLDEITQRKLLGLFKMEVEDQELIRPDIAGCPIYLGMAVNDDNILRFKPQKKIKYFKNKNMNIYNFVIPKLYKEKNLVKVNLEIYLEKNKQFINFKETHEMRYFGLKEINKHLNKNNLKIIKVFDHIRNKKNMNSWALTCITQKIK